MNANSQQLPALPEILPYTLPNSNNVQRGPLQANKLQFFYKENHPNHVRLHLLTDHPWAALFTGELWFDPTKRNCQLPWAALARESKIVRQLFRDHNTVLFIDLFDSDVCFDVLKRWLTLYAKTPRNRASLATVENLLNVTNLTIDSPNLRDKLIHITKEQVKRWNSLSFPGAQFGANVQSSACHEKETWTLRLRQTAVFWLVNGLHLDRVLYGVDRISTLCKHTGPRAKQKVQFCHVDMSYAEIERRANRHADVLEKAKAVKDQARAEDESMDASRCGLVDVTPQQVADWHKEKAQKAKDSIERNQEERKVRDTEAATEDLDVQCITLLLPVGNDAPGTAFIPHSNGDKFLHELVHEPAYKYLQEIKGNIVKIDPKRDPNGYTRIATGTDTGNGKLLGLGAMPAGTMCLWREEAFHAVVDPAPGHACLRAGMYGTLGAWNARRYADYKDARGTGRFPTFFPCGERTNERQTNRMTRNPSSATKHCQKLGFPVTERHGFSTVTEEYFVDVPVVEQGDDEKEGVEKTGEAASPSFSSGKRERTSSSSSSSSSASSSSQPVAKRQHLAEAKACDKEEETEDNTDDASEDDSFVIDEAEDTPRTQREKRTRKVRVATTFAQLKLLDPVADFGYVEPDFTGWHPVMQVLLGEQKFSDVFPDHPMNVDN
jgi:hypothetical protein